MGGAHVFGGAACPAEIAPFGEQFNNRVVRAVPGKTLRAGGSLLVNWRRIPRDADGFVKEVDGSKFSQVETIPAGRGPISSFPGGQKGPAAKCSGRHIRDRRQQAGRARGA